MNHFIGGVILAILLIPQAYSASIYKCTKKDGKVVFADKPCEGLKSTVIHKETAAEIQQNIYSEQLLNLQRLIASEQFIKAKQYALQHRLSEEYAEQLVLHKAMLEQTKLAQEQAKKAAKQADEQAKQQQQLQLQQQAVILQKQQVELQKQQVDLDKAKLEQQQQVVNYPLYPRYVSPVPYSQPHCHSEKNGFRDCTTSPYPQIVRPVEPIQAINPLPVVLTPMNPPNPSR